MGYFVNPRRVVFRGERQLFQDAGYTVAIMSGYRVALSRGTAFPLFGIEGLRTGVDDAGG